MIDYTTQKIYPFPETCPVCGGLEFNSLFSGADDLAEKLESQLGITVTRLFEKQKKAILIQKTSPVSKSIEYAPYKHDISVTTRIFDPSIEYSNYAKVIILSAEGLTASADYLIQEEVYKQLFQLLFALNENQTLILDSSEIDLPYLQAICGENIDPMNAYGDFLKRESELRIQFKLPPEYNLVLISSQETKKELALSKIKSLKEYLAKLPITANIPLTGPYPAKLLRRKNMYSYHLSLKLDRKNPDFVRLRIIIMDLAKQLNLQVRLNPRHLF